MESAKRVANLWRPAVANCILWAAVNYWRLAGEDRALGDEPYILLRATRVRGSRALVHVQIGELVPETGHVRPMGYAPITPQQNPWFLPPILFRGKVTVGDVHRHQEPKPMPGWLVVLEGVLSAVAGLAALAFVAYAMASLFGALGGLTDDLTGWLARFAAMPFGGR